MDKNSIRNNQFKNDKFNSKIFLDNNKRTSNIDNYKNSNFEMKRKNLSVQRIFSNNNKILYSNNNLKKEKIFLNNNKRILKNNQLRKEDSLSSKIFLDNNKTILTNNVLKKNDIYGAKISLNKNDFKSRLSNKHSEKNMMRSKRISLAEYNSVKNSDKNINLKKKIPDNNNFSKKNSNISTISFKNNVYANRGFKIPNRKNKNEYFPKKSTNSLQNFSDTNSIIKIQNLMNNQRPSVKVESKNKLSDNLKKYRKEKNQKEKIKKIINNTHIINIYQNNYIDLKKEKKNENLPKKEKDLIKKKLEESLKKIKKSLLINPLDLKKPKVIIKDYGILKALATNTHGGLIKKINEDRICISLNLQKTIDKKKLLKNKIKSCSILSIFDGHGGTNCCDFLKKNLHRTIFKTLLNNNSLINSLKICYKKLDEYYLRNFQNKSGSCAITAIFYNESLFLVNLGDSRAILSFKRGSYFKEISKDHKPNFLSEFERIKENNGSIYCSSISQGKKILDYFAYDFNTICKIEKMKKDNKILKFGPWRISPGGLSVSRSFGDSYMKKENSLLISEPDIFEVESKNSDFVVIGCKFIS